MPDFINGIKSGPYRKEIIDTLQKLVKGMPASYFLLMVMPFLLASNYYAGLFLYALLNTF